MSGYTSQLQSYGTNLALYITGVSNHVSYLILTNTVPDTNYDILYKVNLSDPVWGYVGTVVGASGTNATSLIVPVGTSDSLFFWAQVTPPPPAALWLEIPPGGFAPGQLTVVVHNTIQDQPYDILTNSDLTIPTTNWDVAQSVSGMTGDSTTVQLPISGQGNLFVCARFGGDSEDIGIPDWWQIKYFGYVGIDPYGDPDGDGWNNLQEFINRSNPSSFDTPPAPQGVSAQLNLTNMAAVISWQSAEGAVIGYTISRYDYQGNSAIFTVGLVNDYEDTGFTYYPWEFPNTYYVQAIYAQGASQYSAGATPYSMSPNEASAPLVLLGAGGSTKLVIINIPDGASEVELTRVDWNNYFSTPPTVVGSATFTVPISSVTNGAYAIPSNKVGLGPDGSSWSVKAVFPNGQKSLAYWAAYLTAISHTGGDFKPGFFIDGSTHLLQNAIFLVRAAGLTGPFLYSYNAGYGNTLVDQPTNYAYASFYDMNDNTADGMGSYGSFLDWGLPFQENYRLRNFVFSTTNIYASGFLNTGCQADYSLQSPYTFIFSATNTAALPAILPSDQTTWMVPYTDPSALGINTSGNQFSLPNNIYNFFGLKLLSVLVVHSNSANGLQFQSLIAGVGSVSRSSGTYYFYPQFNEPDLHTVGFYFGKTANNSVTSFSYLSADPIPGIYNFSPTNAQPILIASVGQIFQVAAFSRQVIANGDTSKPVYISQYFDKAYKVDSNGMVTSEETGVLSPYGDFFPTEPGTAALVTLPDQNGQRGTCFVQVLKLQLDVNHDGRMDLSYFGADTPGGSEDDAAPSGQPYEFWANNDYDRGHKVDLTDFEQDDLGPKDIKGLPAFQQVPDYAYATNFLPAIPCTRDLEDYARLWIPGLSNLLATLPPSYIVRLKTDYRPLRIFHAVESNGGTNYLFDSATAQAQVNNSASLYAGLAYPVWSGNPPLVLSRQNNLGDYFIFCGVEPGAADLTLEIVDTNKGPDYLVGGTTTYITINDIKTMYERWTVGDTPTKAPMNTAVLADRDLPPPAIAYQYPYDAGINANTPYILYVHGWNMESWEKDFYAETSFKRLYWQGYRGRFGSFRWPTGNKFSDIIAVLFDARNYDNSEFQAWKSATGLFNKLTELNAQYPGKVYLMAHSMGNVVAGEALRLAGENQVVNTYIAMEAAIPAHAYDAATPNRSTSGPPDRYAAYWTDGAPCYFSATAGAGTYVNFYNTNDFALGYWIVDQDPFKPDNGFGGAGLNYPGYFYSTPSGTHPSGFYKIIGSIDYDLDFSANTYEIFSYADRAWSYALGAQANVGGVFKPGLTYQQVDLPSVWPADIHPHSPGKLYSAHVWHSAQFRSDNMSRALFWNTVLDRMNLSP